MCVRRFRGARLHPAGVAACFVTPMDGHFAWRLEARRFDANCSYALLITDTRNSLIRIHPMRALGEPSVTLGDELYSSCGGKTTEGGARRCVRFVVAVIAARRLAKLYGVVTTIEVRCLSGMCMAAVAV
jgi:hypothetical protein